MSTRHIGHGLVGAGTVGVLAVFAIAPFADSAGATTASTASTVSTASTDTGSAHGAGHGTSSRKSSTAKTSKSLAPDYGYQKFRVGVQQKDGSYVPAGSSTLGSELTITESGPYVQQQLNKPSVTYTCTTSEADETSPVTYPTGTFCNSSVDPLGSSDARGAHADLTTGPTPGTPFGDQEFTAGPGDTVTITQTTVEPNYVIDSSTATLAPCVVSGVENDGDCASEGATTGPNRSTDEVFDDGGLPPVANPDSSTTRDPDPVDIDVLANDTTGGAPLTGFVVTSDPSHGTATIQDAPKSTSGTRRSHDAPASDQDIRYTPVAGFAGVDHFKYKITDANGSSTTTVTVTVTPEPPLAVDDTATTKVGTPVTIDARANDHANGGGPIMITSVGAAKHGSAVIHDGSIVYTPRGFYTGTDSFPYTISTRGGTSTATDTVTITDVPPLAVNDHATTTPGKAVTIDVLSNDHANGGGPITITSVGTPNHGTAVIHDGTVIYTPKGSYTGSDSFVYSIRTHGGTSQATVTVSISGGIAVTGIDSARLLDIAAGLLVAGGAATVFGRRRYRASHAVRNATA